MEQTQDDSNNISTSGTPKTTLPSAGKKRSRAIWVIILVFTVFVVAVFLTENKKSIAWIEDYQTGIELAKQQNKPALLCFFKQGTRFSSEMWQNFYSSPDVKQYVEANFIPILIDVDKQPEIARR